jgi:AraC-like DNA-binding protein/quercetin dioxygenase-like cupin family protein
LTAFRNQDKLFFKTAMTAKRTKAPSPGVPHPSGWSFGGDIQLANEPLGSLNAVESLASRFVLEANGRSQSSVARPASAFGLSMVAGGLESDFHTHRESQLLYLMRGELTCEASNALWIVPPRSALWIPGDVNHKIRARAPLEGYGVFLEPDAAPNLPPDCCAVSVTPLFRELLLRLATRPLLYDLDSPDARLVSVLLDELATVSIEKHRLPMPADPRLRRLVDAITAHPADGATTTTWAKRIGVGERTLNRLLVQETGLSFGRWRQQLHIILALQRLSRGASVQSVASELGYESASSFVTMFRKALGTSPARYMAQRLESSRTTSEP